MAQNGSPAEQHTKRAVRKASPWIERLARFGYVAYGVVYLLVGVLAMQGALRSILVAPFGKVLLALGLLAYAAWRLYEGVMDREDKGRDAKGIAKRLEAVINGLFHGSLAFYAGQLAFGSGGGGGGSPDDWTATLMSEPFGRWIVLAALSSSAQAPTSSTRRTEPTSVTGSKPAR